MRKSIHYTFLTVFVILTSLTLSPSMVSAEETAPDPNYQYSRALMLKNDGMYEDAIRIFMSLTGSGSQLDRVYYQIASCYLMQKNYLEAKNFARKSIDQNPKFIDPYQVIYEVQMTLRNYDDAADILEELLAENPDEIQSRYLLGLLYYNNMKNLNLSAVSFLNILSSAKENPVPTFYREQANIILSQIYYAQKENSKAVDYLIEAVRLNPRNNFMLYRYASNFLSNGSMNLARICLERFISNLTETQKSLPLMKSIYAYLGSIYFINDDPQANYYLRIGSGDESIENYIAKQLFLLSTDRRNEAVAALVKITSSEYSGYVTPHIAVARAKKDVHDVEGAYTEFITAGSLLTKTDMLNAAYNCFVEANLLKPEEKDPIISLAQISEQLGNLNLAVYYFNQYNEKWPDVEISLHVAYLYDLIGNTSKSEKAFTALQSTDPSYPRLYFIKGLIANKHEKYTEAEQDIQKAISLKADDHNYYYYLAIAQEKNSKYDDAITSLIKALEYDKQNASYQNFLGYLYADRNINLAQAEELLNSALSKDPFNGAFLDSIGWIYYRQGKFDEAIKKLILAQRNLSAVNEDDPVVYEHIGDTYLKLGKTKKAVEYWKQSVALKPNAEIQKKIEDTEKK